MDYPFQFTDAFFIKINFVRKSAKLPSGTSEVNAQLKVIEDRYPEQLQINLRTISSKKSLLQLEMELVGLFKYVGSNPEEDKNLINQFVSEKAITMLWPFIIQFSKILTGVMGIQPVTLPFPIDFKFQPESVTSEK